MALREDGLAGMTPYYGALCDDFFISVRLHLKLDLAPDRETVLHFFDRIRREYPAMRKFRRRDDGVLLLEEDTRDSDTYRWLRLEPSCLRFGYFNPTSPVEYRRYARFMLEQAPCHLTLTELDLDHLEVMYGFDMEYRGNHDQLVAETLYSDHPLSAFILGDEAVHAIDCQPYFGIATSRDCDTQAYVEVKSRTSTYELRTGEYDSQSLSVYLTMRRYWGFENTEQLVELHERLCDTADALATDKAVPLIVNPLAHAIASRR